MVKAIIRNRNFWLHLSFWCVYLSFNYYQASVFQRRMDNFDWSKASLMIAAQMSLTMLICYINYFFLLPRFLLRKNWFQYILEFILPFAIVIVLRVFVQRYIVDGNTHQVHHFYSPTFVIQIIAVTLFIVVFIGFLRFVSDWFEFEAAKKEVENEKLVAELNFLKAQINPHFLFNTLNNLYYLAYSQSPNTTEVISKLSHVMRYMIYESNHDKVLLSQEMDYLENYLALERLRLNDQTTVSFQVIGDTNRVQIAPLILITFLENAFKHGVSNTNDKSWINVVIEVKENVLYYSVENSKSASPDAGDKSGIGLTNVKRRLELLYDKKFDLAVKDANDRFTVHLKLDLSNAELPRS